jgi:hypothetical protein
MPSPHLTCQWLWRRSLLCLHRCELFFFSPALIVPHQTLYKNRCLLASRRPRWKPLDRRGDVATERLEHLVHGHDHGFIVVPAGGRIQV